MYKNLMKRLSILLGITMVLTIPSFAEGDTINSGLSKLNSLISLSKRTYVKELSNDKIFDATYKGLFNSLDLESNYYNKDEFSKFMNQLNSMSVNIGVIVTKKDEEFIVVSVSKDSSAYEKGVLPGDSLITVNSVEVKGKTLLEVEGLLVGREWENIKLKVRREGLDSEIEYNLVCKKTNPDQIVYEVINNLGYIKIFQFNETNMTYFERALEVLLNEEKVEGLIIDVRDNYGGELDATAYVMDKFISKDEKIMVLDYRTDADEELIAIQERIQLPLVIIVNERSIGSAEIFAGGIKEVSNAVVIGKQTFGDGRLQWIVPLQDGSGVKLTIGMIFTPSMKQIDKIGVQPSYVVDNINSEINRVINSFTPMKSIKHSIVGMKDEDTLGAQERLNYLGYSTDELGYFTRDTELELAKFQSDNGILNSGVLNWLTKAKLDEAVRIKASQKIDDLQKEMAVQTLRTLIDK